MKVLCFSVCLAETSIDGESNRVVRFANFLLKVLTMPNMDEAGMELAARALAFLIQVDMHTEGSNISPILRSVCRISDLEIICCRVGREVPRSVPRMVGGERICCRLLFSEVFNTIGLHNPVKEPTRNEQRRLASVLLARELAMFTSTSFFLRANVFFKSIFTVLRDPKVGVL